MKSLIQTILSAFSRNEDLVLATVIAHQGSTPRDTGTRCLIRRDGSIFNTVGGGLVEAKVIEKSASVFKEKTAAIVEFDMANQFLGTDAMICGGNMTLLVEHLEPTAENMAFFQNLEKIYLEREPGLFVIELENSGKPQKMPGSSVITDSQVITNQMELTPEILSTIKGEAPKKAGSLAVENKTYWIEPIAYPKRCFLFGAGHIARATAPLLTQTGFQTTVVDDRAELLSTDHFGDDIDLIHVDQFENSFPNLEIDRHSFIVIMTRGHALDKAVLSQAIACKACYVGMIGSRRKRNTIYQILKDEGVTQQTLDKINCPVGLDIGADTPAEIGVSIVAELIKVRSTL